MSDVLGITDSPGFYIESTLDGCVNYLFDGAYLEKLSTRLRSRNIEYDRFVWLLQAAAFGTPITTSMVFIVAIVVLTKSAESGWL